MAEKYLLILLVTFVVVMNVAAQGKALTGTCPDYPPMNEYDLKKASLGTWHAINYKTAGRQFNVPCHSSFAIAGSDNYLTINSEYVLNNDVRTFTLKGPAVDGNPAIHLLDDSDYEGVKFYETVLDTDYHNYLVKVRCSNMDDNKYNYVAIVKSRKRTLEPQYLDHARHALSRAGIEGHLRAVPQTDCGDS